MNDTEKPQPTPDDAAAETGADAAEAAPPAPKPKRRRNKKLDLSHSRLAEEAEAAAVTAEPKAEQAPEAPAEETPAAEAAAPAAEEAPEPAEGDTEADAEPEPEIDLVALQRTLEALLFSADHALSTRELGRAAGVKVVTVRKAMRELGLRYDVEQRAWTLSEVAGGWQLVTRPDFHPAIQKLRASRSQRKLTQAALETLALIAYSKEPIGRSEIEGVRGVEAGAVLRQLLDRKLIKIAGRGTGLGQPLLYAVSNEFLEHFGLKSAADLPRSGELKGM